MRGKDFGKVIFDEPIYIKRKSPIHTVIEVTSLIILAGIIVGYCVVGYYMMGGE